ncbi:hypothetical protein C9413_08350 [Rhizobium sp. SEMIA 4085]|uniref:Uncharacterized protein n=1 Tax=Rhizobium gallicum bv. gallicum R602sp TaxID=1041138 RepID=A0A0B4X5S0_9HYPH|nr:MULTISPECIES: hypothetical protein [Rhizobium]AJD42476.1 hypothetical protein RGR602_CH03159 [Rhizobium gallicum bv. gallicum R602sp]NNH29508.1 hypothetical protein [Rhizobium sp. SEMIA 4085]
MAEPNSGNGQTISAMFDSESDAQQAADELIESGIPKDAVTLTRGHRQDAPPKERAGFLDAIANFFFTDEQRSIYAEGLRRGGFLVTAQTVSQSAHDTALRILTAKGSIDIDERAEQWRAEGWRA